MLLVLQDTLRQMARKENVTETRETYHFFPQKTFEISQTVADQESKFLTAHRRAFAQGVFRNGFSAKATARGFEFIGKVRTIQLALLINLRLACAVGLINQLFFAIRIFRKRKSGTRREVNKNCKNKVHCHLEVCLYVMQLSACRKNGTFDTIGLQQLFF